MPEFWNILISKGDEVAFWESDITFTLLRGHLPDIGLRHGYDLWISINLDNGFCKIGILQENTYELWVLVDCKPKNYQQFHAIADRAVQSADWDEYHKTLLQHQVIEAQQGTSAPPGGEDLGSPA